MLAVLDLVTDEVEFGEGLHDHHFSTAAVVLVMHSIKGYTHLPKGW